MLNSRNKRLYLCLLQRISYLAFEALESVPQNPNIFTDDDFAPFAITDQPPLTSTTDLNSSCVELEEELLLKKGLDDLNNACENLAADYCPKSDSRKVLATPCPANKNVGDFNSFATAPICKEVETPKLRVSNMAYKSFGDILPLPKALERREMRKIRKGRSLILTDTPEKKIEREAKEKESKNQKKRKVFGKKY